MTVKGKFVSVEGIRNYDSTDSNGQPVTKWVVKYLTEFDYPKKDGTIGKQQILAEVTYNEKPNLQLGAIDDPNVYEMQFYFKVRRWKSKDGISYISQDIILQKASQSVI
jgi:hypothetical protein